MVNKLVYFCAFCAVLGGLFLLDRWNLQRQTRELEQRFQVMADAAAAKGQAIAARNGSALARYEPPRPSVLPGADHVDSAPAIEQAASARHSEPAGDDAGPSPEDQMAYVHSVFESEKYDRAWAHGAENTLGTSLRERLGASTLSSVECRNTLCQARIAHPNEEAFQTFMERVLGAPTLWTGAVSSLRQADSTDGRVHNTMFFTKGTLDMPRLD